MLLAPTAHACLVRLSSPRRIPALFDPPTPCSTAASNVHRRRHPHGESAARLFLTALNVSGSTPPPAFHGILCADPHNTPLPPSLENENSHSVFSSGGASSATHTRSKTAGSTGTVRRCTWRPLLRTRWASRTAWSRSLAPAGFRGRCPGCSAR